MEDGLRESLGLGKEEEVACLNPCFNGRWSARRHTNGPTHMTGQCLNPCFNGRWSASYHHNPVPIRIILS